MAEIPAKARTAAATLATNGATPSGAATSAAAARSAAPRPAAAPKGAARPAGKLDARVGRDHRAIAALVDGILPALIEKLASSGLGELEVREGPWKARLRKPAGAARQSHTADAYLAHAHQAGRGAAAERAAAEERRHEPEEAEEELPILAMSPAVGVFYPRKDLAAGMQVRAGEKIGSVDVLGVREDVVAPIDGAIGASLAESGEAVEYGQGLVRIELPEKARGSAVNGADRDAAAVLGEA